MSCMFPRKSHNNNNFDFYSSCVTETLTGWIKGHQSLLGDFFFFKTFKMFHRGQMVVLSQNEEFILDSSPRKNGWKKTKQKVFNLDKRYYVNPELIRHKTNSECSE